jgi:hypothetical protein
MTMSDTANQVPVSRLIGSHNLAKAGVDAHLYEITNMPGLRSLIVTRPGDKPTDQATIIARCYLVGDQTYESWPQALAVWREERERQQIRDRAGEAMRRFFKGLARPLWRELHEHDREHYRQCADHFIGLLNGFGVNTSLKQGPNGRRVA